MNYRRQILFFRLFGKSNGRMLELVSRASDCRSPAWNVFLGSDRTADKLERTIACSRCRWHLGTQSGRNTNAPCPRVQRSFCARGGSKGKPFLTAQRGRKGGVAFRSRVPPPCPPAVHAASHLGSSDCVW